MHRTTIIPIVALLSVTGCSEQSPSRLLAPTAPVASSNASPSGPRVITGDAGKGSLYAIHVPANWNGDVVFYAHGIKPAAAPIELPTGDGFPAVRDALGQLGYAVAYSSFSENGWAVKDGALRTHQLRAKFVSQVGNPRRSFLMGTSMGGLVVESLAEQFPSEYAGTLAMCAPLGGAIAEMNYIANVRVLFDLFYPGVIPGDVLNIPAGLDLYTGVLGPAQAAVIANPTGLGIIARMKQTPLAGNNGTELVTSLLNALAYDVVGIGDLLDRTQGQSMFDNRLTAYAAAAPGLLPPDVIAFVNASVGRFDATNHGLKYFDKYFMPDANLQGPTITLHTTRDPLVPVFHASAFGNAVNDAGRSSLLLQRSVTAYGHCAFSTDDMVNAFTALASWAETGVKPAN